MSRFCVVCLPVGPEVHEIDESALGPVQFAREFPHDFDTKDEALAAAPEVWKKHVAKERVRMGDSFEEHMKKAARDHELKLNKGFKYGNHVLNVHDVPPPAAASSAE